MTGISTHPTRNNAFQLKHKSHLPLFNIPIEQLVFKFKDICTLAKSVGVSFTSYCICTVRIDIVTFFYPPYPVIPLLLLIILHSI